MRNFRFLLYLSMIVAAGLVGLYVYKFHHPKVMIPVRGEFVKVDGVELYMTVAGEGRPLLLLHGFPYHSGTYDALLKQAWPGRRLIALDLPGVGMSGKQLARVYTPEHLALTVKILLDHLGIDALDVVGHDLGGGVALVLAGSYPTLVNKLVLIAPESSAASASRSWGWWWRTPGLAEMWASWRLGRGLIRDQLQQAWPAGSEGWLQDVERYYRPLETAGGRRGFLNLHQGRSGFHYAAYEMRVRAPVLILWGGADRVMPASAGTALAATLHGRLELLPEVGHLPQEEAAEHVGRLMRGFLSVPDQSRSQE